MTDPIYAVGDIHGHLDQLDRALDLIAADGGPGAQIVFLGDLVDRGPDSRGVIERLMQGQAAGRPWQVLRGNHDDMFRRVLSEGAVHNARIKSGLLWPHPRIGGLATLVSYGVAVEEGVAAADLCAAARAAVPAEHLAFLDALPRRIEREELLFVHAGIRPGVPLKAQDAEDLIWIRDPFLTDPRPHPWLVVHGHTALEYPQHFSNRVDLDGGGGYGRPVHPAVFEGRDCWLLTDKGRVPLKP
ncbi:MAG: metallophosphoesterase family protein [Pseudodonghicola sp.]|nr:metallophosphoesterase family protein [Pseudodonghicola sp.]